MSDLQRFVRADIAVRAKVTSDGHCERHLLLLPTSRRNVPVGVITEVEERTPPQHPSTGTARKNPWRCKQT